MTKEAQQIAIAEACGWQEWQPNPETPLYNRVFMGLTGGITYGNLPDYLNDLNAMHEAEEILSEEHLLKYAEQLLDLVWLTGTTLPNYEADLLMLVTMARADESQRAEAFLRTLDLWKD